MDAMGIRGFGPAIRERREELGMTQRQVAEHIGVTPQSVSYHELKRGIGQITLGMVIAYANALEMEAHELVRRALVETEDTDEQ